MRLISSLQQFNICRSQVFVQNDSHPFLKIQNLKLSLFTLCACSIGHLVDVLSRLTNFKLLLNDYTMFLISVVQN